MATEQLTKKKSKKSFQMELHTFMQLLIIPL